MIGLKYPLKAALTLISVFSPSFSKEVGIVIYTTGGLGTGVYSLVQLKPIKLQKKRVSVDCAMYAGSEIVNGLLGFHTR